MTDFTLDEQHLEALRPLAAVIEDAIKDTPIRLGTDDWGTMLAAGILVRVAAYMGGVLPPAAEAGDWLMRGTRDLSIPDRSGAEEDGRREARRDALRLLIARLERGALIADEKALLRQHVEAEMREVDTARAVAAGNKRHVQLLYADLQHAQAAIKRVRAARDRIANAKASDVDAIWCLDLVDAALDGAEQPPTEA